MSKITPILPPSLTATQTKQKAAPGFDALMFERGTRSSSPFIDDFLKNIVGAADNDIGDIMTQNMPVGKYAFSSSFTETFGTSGPLPAFINIMTSKYNWSAEKNLAFQQIAVNNKNADYTPESIKKIAKELEMAGIGYA